MESEALKNAFKTSVSRHDHHNIEIKAVFETGGKAFEGELNTYVFVPRSFDLRSWSKSDLERDVRTRLRLAIPLSGEQGLSALTSTRQSFTAAINAYLQYSGTDPAAAETLMLDTARELCAAVAETLKQWTSSQSRSLMMAHTVFATEASCLKDLENQTTRLRMVSTLIDDIRDAGKMAARRAPLLLAFEEYLSHLYVQYLGAIRSEFDRLCEPPNSVSPTKYHSARSEVDNLLHQLTSSEAQYRKITGWSSSSSDSDLERETRILRMSHLKKFFQSRSFIEVSRRPALTKVAESTAFAGTALAGLVYAILIRMQVPSAVDVAFQSAFVIGFGVAAYVVRDRLKDWARERFNREARKFLPDYEQVLIAREQRIGEVKEWFNVREALHLPDNIRRLRRNAAFSEIELRLPEDVFHYRKTQTIASEEGDDTIAVKALHESIRINFERYLKHMDDPFKEHLDLDHDGRFSQGRSHRVYHFYIAIEAKCRRHKGRLGRKAQAEASRLRLHRIVLDKTGIVRIEKVRAPKVEAQKQPVLDHSLPSANRADLPKTQSLL